MSTTFFNKVSTTSEKIAALRERLGLTQDEFARKLMISRNYVSLLEGGKKDASAKLLRRMNELAMSTGVGMESTDGQQLEVNEPPTRYVARSEPKSSDILADEVRRLVNEVIQAAGNDSEKTAWILEQARQHLRIPTHWRYFDPENHPAVIAATEAARKKAASFQIRGGKTDTGIVGDQAAS